MGARGGQSEYREVIEAAREVSRSDEFKGLVGAIRTYLATALRSCADTLADVETPITPDTVLDRVARLMSGEGVTSTAS